jgi:3-oxoadipate enol-lactonase
MPLLHVNDIDLYYETAGQGPPLLFIHGLGSSSRDWEHQIPYFSRRYRTIFVDLRGHGRSTIARGRYTIPLFAADLAALLKDLNCGPTHLVGISLGGMIGLQLAVEYPGLCASLVSVNCKDDYRLRTAGDLVFAGKRLFFLLFFGMNGVGRHLSATLFPDPEQALLRQQFIKRWSRNALSPYLRSLQAIGNWSITKRLPEIFCPVLLIAAEYDYTPVTAKETMATAIPDARVVVIPDSRHAVPVEKPAAFNRVVQEFLRKQD